MAFFQGTLQEGIASAVAQLKSVVCFVTDGQDESQLWEDEFLKDETAKITLTSTSVVLRLEAGSTEEAFLAQLYPIPKKPTVVIIKDGALREYIAAGVSKEAFMERLLKALGPPHPQQPPAQPQAETAAAEDTALPPQAASETNASPVHQSFIEQASEQDSSINPSESVPTPAPAPTPAAPQHSFNSNAQAQAVAAAKRATELANQKKKEEAEARRMREEKGKAREEPQPASPPKAASDAPHKHAEALKKKQQEAREERQRILQAIEADKAERKARLAAARAERKQVAAVEAQQAEYGAPSTPLPAAKSRSGGRLSEHAAIQVRLFDGSTIRNRFSSSDTLKDVRQWVDESRQDGKDAFTFKILLTPLPSRTIDITEEDKTLRDLELIPSATLILVHIPKSVSPYSRGAVPASWAATQQVEQNIFQRVLSFILSIPTGIFSGLMMFFSTLFSTSAPPGGRERDDSETPEPQASEQPAHQNGRRIGGLDSIRRRNDQQFYNGNSTNFEPRPNDEE